MNQPLQLDVQTEKIASAIQGDRDSLLYLLIQTQVRLSKFIESKTGKRLAESISTDDLLQNTFVAALANIQRLESSSPQAFEVWLFRIAENTIRSAARKANALKRGGQFNRVDITRDRFGEESFQLFSELVSDPEGTPSQFLARDEAIDAMRVALANLPEDQREAIRLSAFDRLTLAETAEQMNRSTASVRGLIDRARKSLRESLHKSSLWLSKKGS